MIVTLGPTPAWQRTMAFDRFRVDGVNRAARVLEYASGKSINAARVAHTLGARVLAMGFAGGDTGRRLGADLDRAGIAHGLVEVDAPTRTCLTVIDNSRGTAAELVEEPGAVRASAFDLLYRRLARALVGWMPGGMPVVYAPDLAAGHLPPPRTSSPCRSCSTCAGRSCCGRCVRRRRW